MGLNIYMEIAGCPTVCKHCWAQGIPYRMMPLENIRWVLEEAQQFCREAELAGSGRRVCLIGGRDARERSCLSLKKS